MFDSFIFVFFVLFEVWFGAIPCWVFNLFFCLLKAFDDVVGGFLIRKWVHRMKNTQTNPTPVKTDPYTQTAKKKGNGQSTVIYCLILARNKNLLFTTFTLIYRLSRVSYIRQRTTTTTRPTKEQQTVEKQPPI